MCGILALMHYFQALNKNRQKNQTKIRKTRISKTIHFHSPSTVFENQEKVSFNITSGVSYVYDSGGQKLVKNAKIGTF